MKQFDAIVVGAGPAGLFSAYELSKKGLSVLVIEKGSEIKKRKKSNLLSGVGGAGLYSDGKLNLGPVHGKTNLLEFLGKREANELIEYIDTMLMQFGVTNDFYPKQTEEVKELVRKAKNNGIKLILIKHKHIGQEALPAVIEKFYKMLKKQGVKFLLNSGARDIIIDKNKVKGVAVKNRLIKGKAVVVAPGRVGSEWISRIAKRHRIPLTHRGIEVGARVEVRKEAMDPITDLIYDPAFFLKTKTYSDSARTFCVNPGGFVVRENYHGFECVNGYSFKKKKSSNTNFAMLSNIDLTEPVKDTVSYGESIGKLATNIGGGRPIIQRLLDLKAGRRSYWDRINESRVKPTLRAVTPGDISMALPGRIVTNITDALHQLDKIVPGIESDDTLLYAPEIKFFFIRIKTNKELETPVKNLYVAGDGVGVSGNIVGAAATGIIAGRDIVRRLG